MGEVAVYAAVRQQTVEVKCAAVCQNMVAGVVQRNIVKEHAIFNGLGDFGQFLIYDSSGTDIQMAYFGVAHLAFRKTDCQTAGINTGSRIVSEDAVQVWSFSCSDSVSVWGIVKAVAVQNHKHGWFSHGEFLSFYAKYALEHLFL